MRRMLFPAWINLSLFLCFSTVSAQEGLVITSPPTFVVGDTWTYKGHRFPEEARSVENPIWESINVVREVRGSGEILVGREGGTNRELHNRDFNLVERHRQNGVTVYKPFWPIYRYPMRVGDRYEAKFTYNSVNPNAAGAEFERKMEVHVVGWETITVPAGTFKALRVQASGRYQRMDRPTWEGTFEETLWLAPEAKMRSVLYSYVERWQGGGTSDHGSLYSFSMK